MRQSVHFDLYKLKNKTEEEEEASVESSSSFTSQIVLVNGI